MKSINFLLFISVFTGIYLAGNYYVFVRGYQAFPFNGLLKTFYVLFFWFFCLSFVVSRFTGHGSLTITHHFLSWTGSLWIVSVFYFFMIVLFIDFIRLFNIWIHFLPAASTLAYFKLKALTMFSAILVVLVTVFFGYINARSPIVSMVEVTTKKLAATKPLLTVALVTDIHLGSLVNEKRLEQLTELVNAQNPDLILLAGDLLDEAQAPIFKYNIGEPLKMLKAPMGIYAVPGNHEYIGGIDSAQHYIQSLNIVMLRDSVVKLNDLITLIGRDDIQKNRFGTTKRKSIKEMMPDKNSKSFTIVMDHQPYNLNEAREANIDLQVSGHTHNGQFWPFNYIIKAMFELGYGYKKKGETNYYVSSGYGTWGPPVRIGNRPEIAVIKIEKDTISQN
jgi:uncharacterized protein